MKLTTGCINCDGISWSLGRGNGKRKATGNKCTGRPRYMR